MDINFNILCDRACEIQPYHVIAEELVVFAYHYHIYTNNKIFTINVEFNEFSAIHRNWIL